MEDAAARAERWATLLTERRSVSGTDGEAGFAAFLRDLVRGSPAFAGRPEDVWLLPVPGGRHPRHCVLALVRGRGPDTVVLTGHFDTVGTADFGALEPVATDPAALRRALPAMPGVDERAAAEIASGRFVPGRGLLDMKAGLAAMLVALEEHAAAGVPSGNLLFVAVPDEEVDSAGARAAAAALPEVARERGLRLLAAINGDAIADDGDGEAGRAVCLGTVGKLCPAVLVVGRPVHAGYSFRGINALALAGAIAAEMEWEPALAEANEDGGERAGPTLLGMGDGRERYDVTTPGTAWLYWNVITRQAGAGDVLDAVERAAARATEAMSRRLAERRRQATGAGAELPPVRVLRYSALAAEVRRARPDDGMAILAALGSELAAAGLPLPEQCRRLCVRAVELCGLDGPAVVVALASVPYLPTTLQVPAMERAVREAAAEIGRRCGVETGVSARFPAICDMSSFGQAQAGELALIEDETPCWAGGIGGVGSLGLPCVNAGPWGRAYHTRLERMERDYGFRVLPELVRELAAAMLRTTMLQKAESGA